MTDVYVYYFIAFGPDGKRVRSERRATLETIAGLGEAVMESQLVLDHTEVADDGFSLADVNDEAHPMDVLWAEIRSLERRALSRDDEALRLDQVSQADGKYMLRLESRELRRQAQALRRQRAEAMAGELVDQIDSRTRRHYGGTSANG
jgi:HD superfamily phosphohydrolase